MCLFFRYVSQKKFSELEGMLFDGAILLFSHQETASGVNRLNLDFNITFLSQGGPCQVVRCKFLQHYFSLTRWTLPSCMSRRWHRLRLAQKKQGSRDSQSELTRESYSIYGPIVKTPNYSGCTNLFLGTMWTSPCTCPPASSGPARRTQQLDIQGGGQIMNKIFSAHFLSAQEIFFPLHINCQIIRWLSGFTNTSRTHFGKTSNIRRPGNIFSRARMERWKVKSL